MVIPPKEMRKSKLKSFLFLCNTHIASLECLSAVELCGCVELEKEYSCSLMKGKGDLTISVRELLMEYNTEEGS